MIAKDFIIDFANKKISYSPKGKDIQYSVRKFYSFFQDLLDNPANMQYDIPIIAKSPTKFKLINGWTIEKTATAHLKGGILKTEA
jgi:hypothetical protein